jgi:hypothetical protein
LYRASIFFARNRAQDPAEPGASTISPKKARNNFIFMINDLEISPVAHAPLSQKGHPGGV